MKTVFLILALGALVALETPALAQPIAEDLYTEGQAAYDRADYATAIARWQASYDLSKENGLFFNLAQAKRLAGDCVGALAAYRRFVAADTDAASEQHKLAEDFSRELEGTCPPAVISPSNSVKRPTFDRELDNLTSDDDSRPGHTWKITGLVTGGVGIVTIAVGLGLGHHGASIGEEITTACRTNCDWEQLKSKDARGRREVAIGKALDVVGVAAIAGGAIFYYLGVRQQGLAIAPTSRDGGAAISWSRSW